MVLRVKKVQTPADKKCFIRLPWKIYGDYPSWVPPLISEREKFLNPEVNPFFKDAEVNLFMVVSGDQIPVGRIALTLNKAYGKFHSERVGFFGMFEAIDDKEVSGMLLNTAENWCREKKLNKLVGPLNLSINHESGLLVDGFDAPPVIGMPYNPPYYIDLIEQWGMCKVKDLVSLKLNLTQIPEYLELGVSRLRKRDRFTVRPIRMNRFNEEADIMWDVYNSAWTANWGFVPMAREEFDYSIKEVKSFIQPEYFLIAEVNGEPAGFSITLPDVNQVLKKMDGSLFPLGWAKFLWNKNKINSYRVIALGVKKKYRRLGIDAVFYYEIYKKFLEKKIKWCDMSWVLEDNKGMLAPLERIGGKIYKRHRVYERSFDF